MTFWKSSKRREGAISDPKILVADLSTSRKKHTTVFRNKGGAGEGVTGRLEVFRKFIQNGTVKRPLIPLHTRNGQTNGHVKVQPKCAEAVTAKFIFEVLGATAFRKYRFLGSPGKNR